MQTQLRISRERLRARIGQRMEVLADEVADGQATARSFAYAPEIDGKVYLRYADGLRAGDRCRVLVEKAGDYDVWGPSIRRARFVEWFEPASRLCSHAPARYTRPSIPCPSTMSCRRS
jgi:hypothetical protein